MNNRQKLVQEQFLNDEEAVIKRLKTIYGQSLKDINKKVAELDSSIAMLQKALNDIDGDDIGDLAKAVLKGKNYTPQEAQETIRSMLQSKVYQKTYQEALQKQVDGIMDKMQAKEYTAVADYLDECYTNGFVGTMYDLQGQGIPMCFPLDQEQMVRAVQLDSKISKGLYTRLGEDISLLKKKIAAQVSRGIATGMSYQQVAQQLAGVSNIGYNNAVRIARTEGHRIQCQAGMDACEKAKEKGADVLKQWDATLDDATRESHAAVDGEIRELDEKFSNGLMFPGDPDGGAAEVINCRCALNQRARWALDEAELDTLKERAAFFGLDKTKNFEDYKKKYLKAADDLTNAGNNDIIPPKTFVQFHDGKDVNDFFYYDDEKRGLMARKNSQYGKWKASISSDSKNAIYSYTADGYGNVNDYLRKVDGWEYINADMVNDQIEKIDEAINTFVLKNNITVQRGASEASLDILFKDAPVDNLADLIGRKYHDDGFMSSTALMGNTVATTKPVVFDIDIPAGIGRGAYINEFGAQYEDMEYEFLIKRGADFTITDIYEDADLGKVYVKLVMDVD